MGYGGGESKGNNDGSGGVGGAGVYSGNTKPVLVSVLDSYSEDEEISVGDSGPSSSPTYMLTGYLSGYCPKENDKRFWSKKTVLL